MNQEVITIDIELNPLGEIRMGCDGYGVVIKSNFGNIDIFKTVPILIGHSDHSKCIEHSSCKKYLLLKGEFGTYILNIKEQSISIYKITVRGLNNEWSEEQAIFGSEKKHINSFSSHYYLQFPFIHQKSFHDVVEKYESSLGRANSARPF